MSAQRPSPRAKDQRRLLVWLAIFAATAVVVAKAADIQIVMLFLRVARTTLAFFVYS